MLLLINERYDMDSVIVCNGFGDISVHPATMETAEGLVSTVIDYVDKTVVELAKTEKSILVKETVFRTINKLLTEEDNMPVTKTIVTTPELKQEIIMYCFKNNLAIKNNKIESSYDFFKVFKLEDFSCFRDNENYPTDSIITDDYYIEQLRLYRAVVEGKWREGATETSKMNHIIEFVNNLSHRDVKYSLVKVREFS
jgi:hypothetical protein